MSVDMKPAVFLDRDGVLCAEKGYITCIEELEIFDYAKKSIECLHQQGFLAICITNQSAVARGLLTEQELAEIHDVLIRCTGLDALYYCPHHPDGKGVYRCVCDCRKPKTGLIRQAMQEWDIDLSRSYMVGDRASDILCGQNAGIRTVLLESGYGTRRLEQDVKTDVICTDLWEFAKNIKKIQKSTKV